MSIENVPPVPPSRREVWLQVALVVARDGMPEPETAYIYGDDLRAVNLHLDSREQAACWAAHLGLKERPRLAVHDGTCWLYRFDGERDGWSWSVRATEPCEPKDRESELAAHVIAQEIRRMAAVTG